MARHQHTRDEARIMAAIATMPFGGLVRHNIGRSGHAPAPVHLEEIAAYLETLGLVIKDHVTKSRSDTEELERLRSDLAAVARVFGGGK